MPGERDAKSDVICYLLRNAFQQKAIRHIWCLENMQLHNIDHYGGAEMMQPAFYFHSFKFKHLNS